MKSMLVVASVFAFASYNAGAGTTPFSLVGVGDLPGGNTFSRAYSLSRDGQVAVGYSYGLEPNGNEESFRWTRSGGILGGMGDLPGGAVRSGANGVSGDGSVIVGFSEGSGLGGVLPYRWTASTGMTLLPSLPGFQNVGEAYAVNVSGNVAVGYGGGPSSSQAVRWVGSVPTGLGDLPGGQFASVANAVSDDGAVVVGYGATTSPLGSNVQRAFRWTQNAGMVNLGLLPGSSSNTFTSAAEAISGDGQVIFGSQTTFSTPSSAAFRWDAVHGMVAVSGPAGGAATHISGSSYDGSIFVGEGAIQFQPNFPAIWIGGTGYDLAQYLGTHGVDLTGWTLSAATSISGDGSTICGYGVHNGFDEGFVATIPTPTSVAALAAGLVLTACRRRR